MNFVFLSPRGDYFHGKELEFRDMEICRSSSSPTAACLPVTTIRGMLLSSRGGGAAPSLFPVSERTLLEIIAEFFRPKKWSVFSFDFSSLKKFAQNRSTCFWKKENKQQQIPLQLGWSNQFRQSTTLTFVHHTRLSPFNRENNVISIKF